MLDKMLTQHTVSCHDCGKAVTDLTKTRTQIRAELEEQGWDVAIPMFAVATPALGKETYYRLHPEHRRKTTDWCPKCIQKAMWDAAEKLNQAVFRRQQSKQSDANDAC